MIMIIYLIIIMIIYESVIGNNNNLLLFIIHGFILVIIDLGIVIYWFIDSGVGDWGLGIEDYLFGYYESIFDLGIVDWCYLPMIVDLIANSGLWFVIVFFFSDF